MSQIAEALHCTENAWSWWLFITLQNASIVSMGFQCHSQDDDDGGDDDMNLDYLSTFLRSFAQKASDGIHGSVSDLCPQCRLSQCSLWDTVFFRLMKTSSELIKRERSGRESPPDVASLAKARNRIHVLLYTPIESPRSM
jgi:hypothetical protein